jgi:hypothetical protein
MDNGHIDRLLSRLNTGVATAAERKEIEDLIEAGIVDIADIKTLDVIQTKVAALEMPAPSPALDARFYTMLAKQKQKQRPSRLREFFSWPQLAPRFAMASVALILGLAAGYLLRSPSANTNSRDPQIDALSQQVSELQEMMMLSLLENGSTTERLKAVSLTQQMDEASKKVTSALIHTLNNDANVNVRLAALDALKPYASDSSVREALVRSIKNQESPLVQVSLAELMVALQEKAAVKEFERIVESEKTPEPVKQRIRESIDVLI